MISTTNSICHDVQTTLEHHSSSTVALFWCVWGVERNTTDKKKQKANLSTGNVKEPNRLFLAGLFTIQKKPHHANLGAKFA